jgi:hypothetical protein
MVGQGGPARRTLDEVAEVSIHGDRGHQHVGRDQEQVHGENLGEQGTGLHLSTDRVK